MMNEMWTELENYQEFATLRGFGGPWRRMLEDRTFESAVSAEWAAWEAGDDDAADAASEAVERLA